MRTCSLKPHQTPSAYVSARLFLPRLKLLRPAQVPITVPLRAWEGQAITLACMPLAGQRTSGL